MSHVFISHSSQDGRDMAYELAAALEAAGLRCWIAPRDVKPGVAYPGQIVRALAESVALVVLLTAAASRSRGVLAEVEGADRASKLIVPLVVNGTPPSDDLRFFLSVRQQMVWTDAQAMAAALVKVIPVTPWHLAPLAPGTVFRDWAAAPEMVRVPAGSFVMGSSPQEKGRDPGEGPTHTVTIGYPLAVSKYPVTRGQWRHYLQSTGKKGSANGWAWDRAMGKWYRHPECSWAKPGFEQDDNHPVVCVTWDEAREYAKWLCEKTGATYRLLSEAEWEYSARAGTKTAYYWGSDVDSNRAHYYGCGSPWDKKGTAPVGRFAPNAWGLHDMLGNVYEWTEDFWNDTYRGAPADGSARKTGDCNLRVVRGGSWGNDSSYLRAACRCANEHRSTGNNDQGLRLARV